MVVVITGGSKGIGKALLQYFIQNSYSVISCARDANPFIEMEANLKLSEGQFFAYCSADLSQYDGCKTFIDFVHQHTSKVDVLINNTALFSIGGVHQEDEEMFDRMMALNVKAPYLLSRAFIPAMKEAAKGSLITIGSVASEQFLPFYGSYGISKSALSSMTKLLREELRPFGIKVTEVIPSSTLTSSWDGLEVDETKLVDPKDIAEAIGASLAMSPRTQLETIVIKPQEGDYVPN